VGHWGDDLTKKQIARWCATHYQDNMPHRTLKDVTEFWLQMARDIEHEDFELAAKITWMATQHRERKMKEMRFSEGVFYDLMRLLED
jgi:ferritin